MTTGGLAMTAPNSNKAAGCPAALRAAVWKGAAYQRNAVPIEIA